jgi:tetratricopeptide (TPR) repeat protein/O-antigen ligase
VLHTPASRGGLSTPSLDVVGVTSLYALLLWAPLGLGGNRPMPLAIIQVLAVTGLLAWLLHMITTRRLEWRRTALDTPLALLVALVLVQLALGNRPLAEWALGPSHPVNFPPGPLIIGTVSPADTRRSLLLLLTYIAVYVLVVNLVRTRAGLDRLVRTLLLQGGLLAFLGLLDYLAGEAWLFRWRDVPFSKRVSGPFMNADHFAAWLAMLVCLGVGYLLARWPAARPLHTLWRSREGREEFVRRHLPFAGVAVMALSIVFTLSRGGIVSLLVALGFLLIVQGARGRVRRSLVLVGVLLAVIASYGAWIGLGPLLARLTPGQFTGRLVQSLTTLPMLRSFPLLGVGLGAYGDIYFRYQPAALQPGTLYFEFAHNDLLELVVETGLLGGAIFVLAVWRATTDLVMAHLLGRARCPVGGGTAERARRRDPFSVGLGLGALAGVLALLVHSAVDFAVRIPANGVLAATCLGIATVALHTRFGSGEAHPLAAVRALALGPARVRPAIAGAVAVAVALVVVRLVVRVQLADAELRAAGPMTIERTERALALAPDRSDALLARARLEVASARRIWESGRTADGRVLATWPERRREALPRLDAAIQDLRAAIAATPTSPYVHEQFGWAHVTAATMDPERRPAAIPIAIASLQRAVVLQPGNPHLHASLALVALACGEQFLPLAQSASAAAIQREPGLLRQLATRFLPLGLTPAQWAAVVPDAGLDRLELATILEAAGLVPAAEDEYGRAARLLPRGESSFARWKLAGLLVRRGDAARALNAVDTGLQGEPGNPELRLARATILAQRGDPGALAAFRAAVEAAQARAIGPGAGQEPFQVVSPRARALVEREMGRHASGGVVRYRRALAQHLADRKMWEQSLAEWDRVLARGAVHGADHFGRGQALDGLGRKEEALEEYRRAVSLDGGSIPFRLRFAQRLWENDQYYQAVSEWRTVVAQEPGNVDARLALAAGFARTGQRNEAIREYVRILQLAPGQPEARRQLALLRGGSAAQPRTRR